MKEVNEYVEREIVKRVLGQEFRFIRADVHQAEDLPALLALVGCTTVEELAGRYRELCAKVVFGQIDGATIDKAEEVLQKWNGDV